MMDALRLSLDAIDRAVNWPNDDGRARLVRAKCRGLMRGYDARWQSVAYEAVAVETEFSLPVVNPATGRRSRTFQQAGKYDGIIRHDGRLYLLEHKTTSHDVSDPNAAYWRQLAIDAQVSAYMLAHWQLGDRLDGTLYDVIRKPGIAPKKLTKAERALAVAEGVYCRERISDFDRQRLATEEIESPEMYEHRLAADCIERGERYFQRRHVPRLDNEVVEYADELWDVGQAIADARRKGSHYRNSAACILYGSPCEFLGICSGHDSPDSDRWKRKPSIHAELDSAAASDLDTLTYSRIRCFQTCRRKHYYQYEMGIERVDEEEREALFFGTLFHVALAAWWSFFLEVKHGNSSHNSAIAVESVGAGASQATVAG